MSFLGLHWICISAEGVALPWLTFGVAGKNGGGMGACRGGDVCAKGARGR